MTTILLADDHAIVRHGLRSLLEAEPGFSVVGEAANGLEAAELVGRLQPGVLVVDLMMPGLGGLEVARQAARRSPQTRVVILSMHAEVAYVAEARRVGALGYLLKERPADELVRGIREVASGRRFLSPPLSEQALESYLQKAAGSSPDPYETLTAREREVLHLAAEGRTSTEISALLHISSRTVEIHRANFMRKLGLNNQTDLVRYALRRGLYPPDG